MERNKCQIKLLVILQFVPAAHIPPPSLQLSRLLDIQTLQLKIIWKMWPYIFAAGLKQDLGNPKELMSPFQ